VLIYVELDKTEMEQLRKEQKLKQGAEVTAKVYCGRRPLGYVAAARSDRVRSVQDILQYL